jgi:Sulfotransferase domain
MGMLKRLIRKYLHVNNQNNLQDKLMQLGYRPIDQTETQDIFVIGFPKSGNTWMQHIMTGIQYRTDMSVIHNNLVRELIPDEHQVKFYKRFSEHTCFKSHSLPASRYKKVIYIVRDGRDAVVSFYYMSKGMGKNISLRDIVLKLDGLPSSWNDHVQSWLENPYNADIIYIRYEDLKMNPVETLSKVCSFIETTIDSVLLNRIIMNCSFEKMRMKEESLFWGKSKDWRSGEYFLRRGEIGDFKNVFQGELLNYFEDQSRKSLIHFNYI